MFLVVDKYKMLIVLVVVLILSLVCGGVIALSCSVVKRDYLVVIDAGHGGGDGGVKGVESGVSEAEINLLVAFTLKNELEKRDVQVVMTREKSSVLKDGKGSKEDDFEVRKNIILTSNPDVVISIHQNKFPEESRRGAQVFFNNFSDEGKIFAEAVQRSLNSINEQYVGRKFSPLKGDYYLLNCSNYPSCIVECGFLSNREDEKLLLDGEYRVLLSTKIADGILDYLTKKV